ADLAVALAEAADRSPPFPGVGPLPDRPIRLLLAPNRARFDSLTRGRLPSWSEGAAFPDRGAIVLLSDRPSVRLSVALRHELAHLALRWRVGRPLPLWFEAGYAAVAAGEWDRLDGVALDRVAAHYGGLGWAGAAGAFWAVVGTALAWLVWRRRRRDRERKALLDEGWTVPAPDDPTA